MKAYEIVVNRNNDGYQRTLTSMVHNPFDKKTGSGISLNEQLAKELHKPVIKKFKTIKFYARFRDNIWVTDLNKKRSLSYKNKNVKYLLRVMNIFAKYAWVKPLKNKIGKTVPTAFIKIVNESHSKSSKLWVDQGTEFFQ